MSKLEYRRVMLKISGEGLANKGSHGIDSAAILELANKIKTVAALGVELAIVVGGGNFIRGAQMKASSVQRATADYMGMLATVMNAVALQDTCESIGVPSRVLSSIEMPRVAEGWIRRRAIRHLEKGRVVILAAGTGNPHFTTDTAAAQRAVELNCDVLIKATQVDGVYDSDPAKNPDAKRYDEVSYMECLRRELEVMDQTAIAMCRAHSLPLRVMNISSAENMVKAIQGEKVGTLVR